MKLLLTAICMVVLANSRAQHSASPDIWHAAPRYHLSFGGEPGPLRPYQKPAREEGADAIWGWRLGGMVQPARNWVLSGAYSFHESRARVQFVDSTVHVPGHWVWILLPWWIGPHDLVYADQVIMDQDMHSYEVTGGYALPGKWPRKRVFVTGTALTGLRCMAVQERHEYRFNASTPEEAIHVETSAQGWTWMLRLRADLHITKFASVYTEVISSQPLGDLRLSSSATWNGETRTLRSTRRSNTDLFMGFGIAVHL